MVKSLGFILEVLESWWRTVSWECNLSGDIKGSICHDVENRLQGSKWDTRETGWETLAIIKTWQGLRHFPFPVAAVTNYLSGLKQAKFTLLLFWRLKVQKQFHWAQIKGCTLSRGSREYPFQASSAFHRLSASLACGHHAYLWGQAFRSLSVPSLHGPFPCMCFKYPSASLL